MKAFRVLVFTILALAVAISAFGATLTYAPRSYYLNISAGEQQSVPVTMTIDGATSNYMLWFVDYIDGSPISAWIASSKGISFVSPPIASSSAILTVSVPVGTASGKYSGTLFSMARGSHGWADGGTGIYIEVTVGSSCSGAPSLEISSFGPSVIWSPNHSMEEVTVSGTATVPDGCAVFNAGYSIDDEYGEYTGLGDFSVSASGEFSVAIPVEAWRKGQDKDGRHYSIVLFAEGEDGSKGTFGPLEVLVPHDQRKK